MLYSCHSTHAFCTNRIGLDPVHVCSSTWRPCFVKHRINIQVHTISWCQKPDFFEQASSRSTRNSSSENKGTFHVSSSKNSKFNIRSSRSLSSFKFQASSHSNQGLIPPQTITMDKFTVPSMDWLTQVISTSDSRFSGKSALTQTRRSKGQTTLAMGRRQRIRDL